ncbi:hypothetical protein AVEN_119278-1 [Araneus ventricosus]|uniref:Uncharacterized protein n=1 Tax=Araneus ventricosus TaxID=182803 RepID=A0A4Y2EHT9_ARAVE|nr:hypothetical protein AVEN_119278-1 [Araneus ventricosus]
MVVWLFGHLRRNVPGKTGLLHKPLMWGYDAETSVPAYSSAARSFLCYPDAFAGRGDVLVAISIIFFSYVILMYHFEATRGLFWTDVNLEMGEIRGRLHGTSICPLYASTPRRRQLFLTHPLI